MNKLYFLIIALFSFSLSFSQIYRPEGINIPGEWNGWQNPPANKLAFASDSQVVGGRVHYVDSLAYPHYQAMFSTMTGGDTTAGTYMFLFTSGPSSNPYNNKWANVNVQKFSIQTYTYQGANNNVITIYNNRFYVVNFEDNGYVDTRAVFFELGDSATRILNVTQSPDSLSVTDGQDVTVTVSLSKSLDLEEHVYVRYTTDNWVTDSMIECNNVNTNIATAFIPAQTQGTKVYYYVFTTAHPNIYNFTDSKDIDLLTIYLFNNGGNNYSYTVNSTTTGLGDINSKDNFIIYPNPARDFINISNAQGYMLEITDMQGRIIKKIDKLSTNSQLNLSDVMPGLYLFKFSKKGETLVKKISIK